MKYSLNCIFCSISFPIFCSVVTCFCLALYNYEVVHISLWKCHQKLWLPSSFSSFRSSHKKLNNSFIHRFLLFPFNNREKRIVLEVISNYIFSISFIGHKKSVFGTSSILFSDHIARYHSCKPSTV